MYAIFALCLLGLATAQTPAPPTITDLTACITKEQNLKMECSFVVTEASPTAKCEYMKDGKLMGSTDNKESPDPTYKNRANVTMEGRVCQLTLTGLEDKPQEIKCVITQTVQANKVATVDKKNTPTCSGFSYLLQKGTGLSLLLLTLPLLSELL